MTLFTHPSLHLKVLEHRHHVLDLLNQYSTERPVSNGSVAVTAGVLKSRDRT